MHFLAQTERIDLVGGQEQLALLIEARIINVDLQNKEEERPITQAKLYQKIAIIKAIEGDTQVSLGEQERRDVIIRRASSSKIEDFNDSADEVNCIRSPPLNLPARHMREIVHEAQVTIKPFEVAHDNKTNIKEF